MPRSIVALFILVACVGGDGPVDVPDAATPMPALVVPAIIDLPYVPATMTSSSLDVTVANPGEVDTRVTWALAGDEALALVRAPTVVPAGGTATLTLAWSGAATPRITSATLTADSDAGVRSSEVWAVAGDPALPPAEFSPVRAVGRAGGAEPPVIGDSAVLVMPTAPFPAPGRPWTDGRVHVFVPADYRQRDAHDVVLHFHGHRTTIDATVAAHRYREQLHASGTDAILVVPQGPVDAASGDFGKLADPAGTAAFVDELLTVLYRAGRLTRPVLGEVVLTSHSGGYAAVAANLAPDSRVVVRQVGLFDSLYGYVDTYRTFVLDGGRLRSNYTAGGGTDANNEALAAALASAGIDVAAEPTVGALRDRRAVIYFTPAAHAGATREGAAFAEALRWSHLAGRRGPRAELRAATATAGHAVLAWRAAPDPDLTGWRVETSPDGTTWSTVADVAADATSASVPLAAAVRVRVVPVVAGVSDAEAQPTDTYAVAPTADVLVVDGFDRVVDGSWGGLAHDFAARVAVAVGPVHTVAAAAITDDGFDLAPYPLVVWLEGDDAVSDHTFNAAARAAIDAYLAGGGRLIASGSEIGFELGPSTSGAAWLAATFGAVHAADDAGTSSASGPGVPAFTFGTAAAPYAEDFPDAFSATGAGAVLLRYATGEAAAVAVPGQAALVGFPLETIEDPAALVAVTRALRAAIE